MSSKNLKPNVYYIKEAH